jgi:hypothetical protein
MTIQSQFTFVEAKNFCLNRIYHFVAFAESLFDISPNPLPMEYIIQLETLKERIIKANRPNLFETEIHQLWRFGQAIVYFNPDITRQLRMFWDLHLELLKFLQTSMKPFAIRDKVSEAWEKIQKIDNISQEIVGLSKKQKKNILSATALLLINVVRVESVEKALLEQLKMSIARTPTCNKFDRFEICSVEAKVLKKNKWRTDVRAIRDATAHAQFKITILQNGWEISFSNHDEGYHFDKQFKDYEFFRFFDRFTLLYKSQLILLLLFEMLPVLSTHFLKK